MVKQTHLHKRAKTSFNEDDIKYLEKLMKKNKSAELALIYVKIVKAKTQQDKNRESSRLSKQRHREELKME